MKRLMLHKTLDKRDLDIITVHGLASPDKCFAAQEALEKSNLCWCGNLSPWEMSCHVFKLII